MMNNSIFDDDWLDEDEEWEWMDDYNVPTGSSISLNKTPELKGMSEKKCTCGAHSVYGKDCEFHDKWCDLNNS